MTSPRPAFPSRSRASLLAAGVWIGVLGLLSGMAARPATMHRSGPVGASAVAAMTLMAPALDLPALDVPAFGPPALGPRLPAGPFGSPSPALVHDPTGGAAVGAYRWPLAGDPTITRRFDPPAQPWLPGHRGVDLAGQVGQIVYAAGPGWIGYAGSVAGVAVVTVIHPDGLRTTYEPVKALLAVGSLVRAGTPIGTLMAGHPGCPVGACLHWGLRQGEAYLDPLALVFRARLRLLPLAEQPGQSSGQALVLVRAVVDLTAQAHIQPP